MPHPLLSAIAPRPRDAAPSGGRRQLLPVERPEAVGAEVAVLLTGSGDVAAAVRICRTVLPRAQVWLYGADLSHDERESAVAAGAGVRPVPPCGRDTLVRRMLAEVDADIYILAHATGPDDMCVAPLVVAEVDAGQELVDVSRFTTTPSGGAVGGLLRRTVDFAFGGGSDILHSDFKACSRRFALSYCQTAPRGGSGASSARELALHALRLRLPIGRAMTLGAGRPDADSVAQRGVAGWFPTLRIVARLLVEERPRRVFGLFGLALVALGVVAAAPELKVHHWRAVLLPGPQTLAALALLATGAAFGAAGAVLDALASARQEVKRLGVAAIPRRADRLAP